MAGDTQRIIDLETRLHEFVKANTSFQQANDKLREDLEYVSLNFLHRFITRRRRLEQSLSNKDETMTSLQIEIDELQDMNSAIESNNEFVPLHSISPNLIHLYLDI